MSVIGTVLVALCCFTPILVICLARWPGGLTGYLDVVLLRPWPSSSAWTIC